MKTERVLTLPKDQQRKLLLEDVDKKIIKNVYSFISLFFQGTLAKTLFINSIAKKIVSLGCLEPVQIFLQLSEATLFLSLIVNH